MGIIQKTHKTDKAGGKKRFLPLAFLALFSIATLTQVFAPATYAAIDPTTDRLAYANAATLYYGFMDCLAGGDHKDSLIYHYKDYGGDVFTAAHAASGDWFVEGGAKGTVHGVSSYLDGNNHLTSGASYGKTICNDILKKGTQAWGFATPLDILCDANINRNQGASCQSGEDDGFKLGNDSDKFNSIANAIKAKAFGGNEPSLTGAHNYLIYLEAFKKGCNAKAIDTGSGDRNYTGVQIVQSDDSIVPTRFEASPKSDKRYVYANSRTSSVRQTCGQIANAINQYAPAYAESVKQHGIDESADPENQDGEFAENNTCGVDSGWFICPIIETTAKITDGLYDNIISLFVRVPPISTDTSESNGMYQAWKSFRNIANVAFIIAFMVIIYSQVTSAGISNYGVKKMLPRLIIAALLVNVSYFVSAIAVDLSNIAGASISEFLGSVDTQMTIQDVPSWADLTTLILSLGTVAVGVVAGITLGPELALSLIGLIAPLLIGALLAILSAVVVLILRQAAIIILVILSPLAFVAMLLPNTEKWFTKWRQWFFSFLLLYPAIAVLFGGAKIAGQILANAQTSGLATLLAYASALFVTAAPLFLIPFMIRQYGGNGIDKLGGKIQARASSLGKKASSPLNTMRKDSMKRAGANLRRRSFEKIDTGKTDEDGKKIERFRRSGGVGRFIRYNERRKAETAGQESEAARAEKNYVTDELAGNEEFRERVSGTTNADKGDDKAAAARNRVLARALTEQDRADDEEVANAEIIMLSHGLNGAQRLQMAKGNYVPKVNEKGEFIAETDDKGNKKTDEAGNIIYERDTSIVVDGAMQRAAIDAVFTQGSASQKEEIIAMSGNELIEHKTRIGKHVAKMAGSDPALGGQTIDGVSTGLVKSQDDLDHARARGVTQGRIDAKNFAEMSPSALNLTFESIYRNLENAKKSKLPDRIAEAQKAEKMFKEAAYNAVSDPRLNQSFNGNDERKEIVEKLNFGGDKVVADKAAHEQARKDAAKQRIKFEGKLEKPWVGTFTTVQKQQISIAESKPSGGSKPSQSGGEQQLVIERGTTSQQPAQTPGASSGGSAPNVRPVATNQTQSQAPTSTTPSTTAAPAQSQAPPAQSAAPQQPAPTQAPPTIITNPNQARDAGINVPWSTPTTGKAPAPRQDTWQDSTYRGTDQTSGPTTPPTPSPPNTDGN